MRLSISFIVSVAVLFVFEFTAGANLACAGPPTTGSAVAESPPGVAAPGIAKARILFHGKSLGGYQQALQDAIGQAGPPPAGQVWVYVVVAAWVDPFDPAGPMYHVVIDIIGTAPVPVPGGGIK